MSRGAGVGFETGDEVREIALAQRLHVADVMATVDVEADQQKTLLDAPCAAVGAFPAVHVGEGQIAVADARRAGEAFDGGLVFEPHGRNSIGLFDGEIFLFEVTVILLDEGFDASFQRCRFGIVSQIVFAAQVVRAVGAGRAPLVEEEQAVAADGLDPLS